MTTDGGGWVLVGRGRNGWSWAYNGRGTSDEVSGTVTGTAAFDPKQLDSNVINALLGGKRLDEISPELRVRRARNVGGTNWQEVRMTLPRAERWTWAWGAGIPVSRATFDGTAVVSNTTTRNVQYDNAYRRLIGYELSANGYQRGMNYGASSVGNTSSSSYLYSSASNGSYASPFAQVFIRPKLRAADVTFDVIADSGTAQQSLSAVPNNYVESQTWGVTGLGNGGTSENATEVQAFAQVGNVMFAGGNFTRVQRGEDATGSNVFDQPYLAAFDAATGDYVSSFQPPRLNSQVKALAALPGNRLAIGGEFTQVGGQDRAGFVVVDATTGAVDTAWTTAIANKLTGGTVSIRALDVAGDYLYVAGAMTHFTSGSSEVYAQGWRPHQDLDSHA